MAQYHFDPRTYQDLIAAEVPDYDRLQAELAAACRGVEARRILDLGTGTGATAAAALAVYPDAELVGVDESADMLAVARQALPGADLRTGRLEEPLPVGPFGLVVSALAVHHLDGPGKADLFRRVSAVLAPGGRFVLADVVVPVDPADVVTPIDGVDDTPSTTAEQLAWLADAGLAAGVAWAHRDLVVLVGDRPAG